MLKLRWKLLILLLIVALVPLIFVRLADVLAMRKLGREAANQSRAQLVRAAESQLRQVLNGYAKTLSREESLLRLLLEDQARAVSRSLDSPIHDTSLPIYYESQFSSPDGPPPPGLALSDRHLLRDAQGNGQPMRVSYQAHVTRLSPNSDEQLAHKQAIALAGLHEDYRHIYEVFPEAILWQYTSFESGLHLSYPGKGGYPKDYDPRLRRWYRHTIARNITCWTTPEPDVTTLTPTFTLGTPLHNAKGKVIGVTAIDVPIAAMLGRTRLTTDWAADSVRYMLTYDTMARLNLVGVKIDPDEYPRLDPNKPMPYAFARSGADAGESDWRVRPKTRPVICDDPEQFELIRGDMAAGRSAIRLVTVDRKQTLWAYGPLRAGASDYLMIAVPYASITAGTADIVDQIDREMWASLQSSGVILLMTLGIVVLVVWRGSRAISQPVTRLAAAARGVAEGNLDARVSFRQHFRDELNDMAEAFNTMVPKLRDRIRMRDSLALAMEVQQSLLPKDPPQMPGLDLAGCSVYCDETGGDYYDFLEFEPVDTKRMGVVIGDVVGHGVAAALLMATTRALLRSRIVLPGSVSEVFNDVNAHLCNARFTGRFMTLFYLLIDVESQQLRWLSAGHDPALLYHPGNRSFEELAGQDIPLGLQADWEYHEFEKTGWDGGEVIVLGTDGIWEARNPADEMFGKQRLHGVIEKFADQPAAVIAREIDAAVKTFRGNRDQLDDITHVVVKLQPTQE